MDVMVIGGGGREHAIVSRLARSPRVGRLYALPGNGGIGRHAECVPIKAEDLDAVVGLLWSAASTSRWWRRTTRW